MKNILYILFIIYASCLFAQDGLVGEYYNGTNFETKVLTRTDMNIDFYWGDGGPQKGVVNGSYYSVRWTGKILVPETGKYLFSAKVDDGIRLWVNNVPMINEWDLHNWGDFSNSIILEAGKTYSIKLEYFNAMLEGEIKLLWQLPSQVNSAKYSYNNFKPVPQTYLYQPNTVPNTEKLIVITPKKPIATTNKPKPESRKTPSVSKVKESKKPPLSFEKMDSNLDIKQIFFIRSVNEMTDNSIERLDKVIKFLVKNEKARLTLNGHTDVLGDTQKNLELSISRAKSVADYLISKGISEKRISYQGFGSNKPFIEAPKTEEERALNRRVEFVIELY